MENNSIFKPYAKLNENPCKNSKVHWAKDLVHRESPSITFKNQFLDKE